MVFSVLSDIMSVWIHSGHNFQLTYYCYKTVYCITETHQTETGPLSGKARVFAMTYVYGRTWSYSKWMDACCHGSSIGKYVLAAIDVECVIQWPYKIELKSFAIDIQLNYDPLN